MTDTLFGSLFGRVSDPASGVRMLTFFISVLESRARYIQTSDVTDQQKVLLEEINKHILLFYQST
jgi:hypothetical protein